VSAGRRRCPPTCAAWATRSAEVTRSPYQRRHGLATIRLALPDGERTIPFLDHTTAIELANRSLFEVETAPHLEL
jgi:putative membrane protein